MTPTAGRQTAAMLRFAQNDRARYDRNGGNASGSMRCYPYSRRELWKRRVSSHGAGAVRGCRPPLTHVAEEKGRWIPAYNCGNDRAGVAGRTGISDLISRRSGTMSSWIACLMSTAMWACTTFRDHFLSFLGDAGGSGGDGFACRLNLEIYTALACTHLATSFTFRSNSPCFRSTSSSLRFSISSNKALKSTFTRRHSILPISKISAFLV